MAEELSLLSGTARLVLEGAAVAGDPFEPELAAAASLTSEAAAMDADGDPARGLTRAQFRDNVRFRERSSGNESVNREATAATLDVALKQGMEDALMRARTYISAGADRIFAQPGTFTGSIGVVFARPNVDGLLRNAGISSETISRGRFAYLDDITSPIDQAGRAKLIAEMSEWRLKTVETLDHTVDWTRLGQHAEIGRRSLRQWAEYVPSPRSIRRMPFCSGSM